MSVRPAEQRPIDLCIDFLDRRFGPRWTLQLSLDEQNQNRRSPECLLSNGELSAAVEVKRLTGDSVLRAYNAALQWWRSFSPPGPGFYVLGPAPNLRMPADKPLLRTLIKEIHRVVPELARGETGAIRLRRSAWVSLLAESGPGLIYCCHNYSEALFQGLESSVRGSFLLVDHGLPDHHFITKAALDFFREELVAACARRLSVTSGADLGELHHLTWYEEVPVLRCDDDEDPAPGFEVLAVTEARNVDSAVIEGLDHVLSSAVAKFEGVRRWTSKHIIILDRADGFSSLDRLKSALAWLTGDDLPNIDIVLLADGQRLDVLWEASSQMPGSDKNAALSRPA